MLSWIRQKDPDQLVQWRLGRAEGALMEAGRTDYSADFYRHGKLAKAVTRGNGEVGGDHKQCQSIHQPAGIYRF